MQSKVNIGSTYGMLTVDAIAEERDARGRKQYHCTCECGGTRLVTGDRLLAGSVISCGCQQKAARTKIGGSKERAGWTPEQETARLSTLMNRCAGIYLRGDSTYIAQIKIRYKTIHIGCYSNADEAHLVRQEVVRIRIEEGADAAIQYIADLKKARWS